MIYTNKLNLPQSIVDSVKDKYEPQPNRYSITELLGSVQQIILFRKHFNQIEVDVSDSVQTLFGTAVHNILEENTNESDVETEIKMEVQIGQDIIVGKFDRRNLKEQLIEDYKTGKTSMIIKQDFEEYRLQGLGYAWMTLIKTGVITKKLKFYILLKDWSKIKASTSANYPQSPIYVWEYNIQDSDYDYIEKYIKDKLTQIHTYSGDYKGWTPGCSDEERWYTGTTYAVYKNVGDKRATYTTNDEEDAHNYITNKLNGAGEIQVRRGEYLKCKLYCNCNKFCEQFKKENN